MSGSISKGGAIVALAIGATVLVGNAHVHAADLNGPVRGRYVEDFRPQSEIHRRFYVRADVGLARNDFGDFSQKELADNSGHFVSQSIGDNTIIGAGIGWQLSSRFRLDLTGEYRATANVRALDNLVGELIEPAGTLQANTLYQGHYSTYLGMINGYWDLFRYRGFTPYLGAGIGFAINESSGFVTSSTSTFHDAATGGALTSLTTGTAKDHSSTQFAWALMAGTSYDLSPNAKLDIGYRYVDLGSGVSLATGLLDCVCGTVGDRVEVSDLTSHDFRIGIRWMLGGDSSRPAYVPMK